MAGPVLVLTGPPGAGKTTVARLVAARFERAACVECDWFWTTIVQGHIEPWLPTADEQNRTVLRACAAAAAELSHGGYPVVLEGIVGPWFLPLVRDVLGRSGGDVHYVVLRPDLDVTVARATGRTGDERVPGRPALVDEGPVRLLWELFQSLGLYERHVIDTTALEPAQTATIVGDRFADGTDRL